jgi:hypothetical protein
LAFCIGDGHAFQLIALGRGSADEQLRAAIDLGSVLQGVGLVGGILLVVGVAMIFLRLVFKKEQKIAAVDTEA